MQIASTALRCTLEERAEQASTSTDCAVIGECVPDKLLVIARRAIGLDISSAVWARLRTNVARASIVVSCGSRRAFDLEQSKGFSSSTIPRPCLFVRGLRELCHHGRNAVSTSPTAAPRSDEHFAEGRVQVTSRWRLTRLLAIARGQRRAFLGGYRSGLLGVLALDDRRHVKVDEHLNYQHPWHVRTSGISSHRFRARAQGRRRRRSRASNATRPENGASSRNQVIPRRHLPDTHRLQVASKGAQLNSRPRKKGWKPRSGSSRSAPTAVVLASDVQLEGFAQLMAQAARTRPARGRARHLPGGVAFLMKKNKVQRWSSSGSSARYGPRQGPRPSHSEQRHVKEAALDAEKHIIHRLASQSCPSTVQHDASVDGKSDASPAPRPCPSRPCRKSSSSSAAGCASLLCLGTAAVQRQWRRLGGRQGRGIQLPTPSISPTRRFTIYPNWLRGKARAEIPAKSPRPSNCTASKPR